MHVHPLAAFLWVALMSAPALAAVTDKPSETTHKHHKKHHETHDAEGKPAGKKTTTKPPSDHATAHATHPAHATTTRAPVTPIPPAPPPPAVIAAPAPAAGDQPKGSASGLPLPRYAALRSDDVNFRAGPGTRYPIDWIYKRRDLPVEIEREFEVWRLVRDPDGTKGWVHQATLTGRRSAVIAGADRTLRASADDAAASVAILKLGVIVHVRKCDAGASWCEVQSGDYRGWLRRDQVWGVQPDEAIS